MRVGGQRRLELAPVQGQGAVLLSRDADLRQRLVGPREARRDGGGELAADLARDEVAGEGAGAELAVGALAAGRLGLDGADDVIVGIEQRLDAALGAALVHVHGEIGAAAARLERDGDPVEHVREGVGGPGEAAEPRHAEGGVHGRLGVRHGERRPVGDDDDVVAGSGGRAGQHELPGRALRRAHVDGARLDAGVLVVDGLDEPFQCRRAGDGHRGHAAARAQLELEVAAGAGDHVGERGLGGGGGRDGSLCQGRGRERVGAAGAARRRRGGGDGVR